MTVHDLMMALLPLPPDLPVFVWTPGQYLEPHSAFQHLTPRGGVVLIEGNEVTRVEVEVAAIKTA